MPAHRFVLLLASVLLASACTGDSNDDNASAPASASPPTPSVSASPASGPVAPKVIIVKSRSGSRILVVTTYGSGTCPFRIGTVRQVQGNALQIVSARSGDDQGCTADVKVSTDEYTLAGQIDLSGVTDAIITVPGVDSVLVPISRGIS